MKRNKFLILLLAITIVFTAGISTFAQEETMTNDEVIMLVKNGLSESIVVNKIRTSKTDFDLSTDELIKLKKAGVSDAVVNAMLEAKSGKMNKTTSAPGGGGGGIVGMTDDPNNPQSKHGYGIYMYEEVGGERKMTQLQPNVSAQTRTGGLFTSSMTYGIGKVKQKANLPNRNASLQIKDSSPVFYFYLDTNSGGLNTTSGIPSTPNEFVLVRFNQRSDNREITIGKANAFGAKGGLSDEYVVQFTAEDMGNGTFKITPSSNLTKGEYAFFLTNSGSSNAGTAVGLKFFDFGVNMTP